MSAMELGAMPLFRIGPLTVTDTVVVTWGIMLVFAAASWLVSRALKGAPSRLQSAAEGALVVFEKAIGEVVPADAVRQVLPFIATLWLFIVVSNLAGLVPGLHAPTRDLSATSALALLVFGSTHWFGIRRKGWRAYLKHYAEPSVILMPFHVISEFTRTLALAIRLFGNMMSLEMAAMLMLLIAGFLVPVPLLLLHAVEALVQAYIFGMLALIYIGSAIEQNGSSSTSSKETS